MPAAVARVTHQVEGYILVTFHIYPEGNQYVSECLELGTATCGDTIDEALNNIVDATVQYLNAIETNGERTRIFRKRNIPIYPAEPVEKRQVPVRNRDIVSSRALPLAALVTGSGTPSSVF